MIDWICCLEYIVWDLCNESIKKMILNYNAITANLLYLYIESKEISLIASKMNVCFVNTIYIKFILFMLIQIYITQFWCIYIWVKRT